MLETLSVDDFAPLLAAELQFRAANGSFALELLEAEPLRQPSPRPLPPFRLLLRSAAGLQLPQGSFELQHPRLGPLLLFMVPIQPDARGPLYEIILN